MTDTPAAPTIDADRYRAALQQIIDAEPEWIEPSDELVNAIRECEHCEARRQAKWPPSGLCDPHYREFEEVARANERRRRYFATILRNIAREALTDD